MAFTLIVVVMLLVIGFSLVTIEALTPGVHVFGIAGGLMILAGIVYATLKMGITGGAVTLLASVVTFAGVVTFAVKSGTWRRMTLETEQRKEQGYRTDDVGLTRFLGKRATVLHDLRPVGYIDVEGQRVEAVSESDFVGKGGSVDVVRVDGVRLVVRPVQAPSA